MFNTNQLGQIQELQHAFRDEKEEAISAIRNTNIYGAGSHDSILYWNSDKKPTMNQDFFNGKKCIKNSSTKNRACLTTKFTLDSHLFVLCKKNSAMK